MNGERVWIDVVRVGESHCEIPGYPMLIIGIVVSLYNISKLGISCNIECIVEHINQYGEMNGFP